ncbi:carboxylesterase/lipase family protein [Nonomuraea sp. GTA35]|uniref:carboxylesterase/lipase family protein n=1 Tax=Nonomuraea sp. GTA35 TaxID=1676746 RepID=UPI0035BF4ED0
MVLARTVQGKVQGRIEDGIAVFRGIPFARPPVGPLRFAAPRPPEPWDGTRQALSFGPPPPQAGLPRSSDDWLTVNVWSPDPGGSGLPVMVFVYGGSYLRGTASNPMYDGAGLAAQGVVVVTFNHRVGAEGFAWVDGAPADRGLLDQVAALRWVRDNISAFGGDPDLVTVFGESAGAVGIASLLVMESAAGLFRRAIVQSLSSIFHTPRLARALAAELAAEAAKLPSEAGTPPAAPAVNPAGTDPGRPGETVLARFDPDRLVAAAGELAARIPKEAVRWGPAVAATELPFAPVVDGEVLPRTPWEHPDPGVDLLVMHTRDESRLWTVLSGPGRPGPESYAPHLAEQYRRSFPGVGDDLLHEIAESDWLFRMPAVHLAEAHAGRTFLAELCWSAAGGYGACHGLDIKLLFGAYAVGPGPAQFGERPSDEAVALTAYMRKAWTSFAAGGDPGWPAYDADRRLTLRLDADPAVVPYPEEVSRRIWAGHRFQPLDLPSC